MDVLNKGERQCIIADIAIPGDRISVKEKEKSQRYEDLKRELKRIGT